MTVHVSRRRIATLFALLAVLAILWIIGTPPSAGPDEPSHVVRSAALVRGELEGEKDAGARVAFILPAHIAFPDPGCFAFQPEVPASCATSLATPDGDARLITSATTYPIWGHLAPGVGSLLPPSMSRIGVRVLDVTIPLLLVGGALIAATRRGALVSTSVVLGLTVPAWFAMIVVNPSGYVISGAIALWIGLLGANAPPSRLERLLLAGGWAAMVLPRRDGLIYATLILCAALLITSTGLHDRWRTLGRSGQAVVVGSTVATVLWAVTSDQTSSNLLLAVPVLPFVITAVRRGVHGRIVTPWAHAAFTGVVGAVVLLGSFMVMSRRTTGFQSDVLQSIIRQTGIDLTEAIGRVGWLDTPVPDTAIFSWLIGLGLLAGAALVMGDLRRLVGAAMVVVGAIWISWVLTMAQNDPSGLYWQGRYYLPLLVGAPILLGHTRLDDATARRAGRTITAIALVVMTVGFGAAMRRWAVGTSGTMMPWRWDTYDTLVPPILLLWFHMVAAWGLWSWLDRANAADRASTPAAGGTAAGGALQGGALQGVNVLGYHHAASGLGHVARQLTTSLRAAGVPVHAFDVEATSSPTLRSPGPVPDDVFDTTIAVVTAPQLAGALDAVPQVRDRSERTIGYFFWELDTVPDDHLHGAGLVDAIWTPTTFVAAAYRKAVPSIGVRVVPTRLAEPSVETAQVRHWRDEIAPNGEFVFVTSFDFLSVVERKNPMAAIDAFGRAFDPARRDVRLVIKTINGDQRPDDLARVAAPAAADERIAVIDRFVPESAIDALIEAADCLVSLHRGEGLGLAMATAMWSGTPIIATDYSGNLDFMDATSAELVRYDLVPVLGGEGAYPDTTRWAEPDRDAAAASMRRIADDPEHRNRLILNARRRIASQAGPAPYGAAVREALDPGASGDVTVAPDFNETLHELRGQAIAAMPAGARSLVSVGCAGGWYFDWIAQRYGEVVEHIGIEFYSPEPDDLPPNVRWIANTAGDLASIVDDEADLLFSGQNIEHLWPADVVGFLCEANRVLRNDGTLVVDSPNRIVTAALGWSQPEHTVEFSTAEAIELISLAGFDIDVVKGLWNCRSRTGGWLPLLPADVDEVVDRSAADDVDDAFVWWIEARRVRAPDRVALTRRVEQIFAAAWPERIRRWQIEASDVPATRIVTVGDSTRSRIRCVEAAAGHTGVLFQGPSAPLTAGRYRVSFRVRVPGPTVAESVGDCQIVIGGEVVAQRSIVGIGQEFERIEVEVDLAEQCFDVQFRIVTTGRGPLVAEVGATLDPERPHGI